MFPVEPGELVIRKSQSDAFSNPDPGSALAAKHVDGVVVAGMQSNYCVSATSRGALQNGLRVTLASRAHATYDEGKSAGAVSTRVEQELRAEGVTVALASEIRY